MKEKNLFAKLFNSNKKARNSIDDDSVKKMNEEPIKNSDKKRTDLYNRLQKAKNSKRDNR